MASPPLQFTLFPQLPAELRKEIWRFCLPHRVWELTQPVDEVVFFQARKKNGRWPCSLGDTTFMNSSPPLITQVCHESRSVAFETGGIVDIIEPFDDMLAEIGWESSLDNTRAWRDHTRDAAHLNWTSAYEPEWYYDGE